MENMLELFAKKLEEDSLAVEIDTEDVYTIRLTLDAMGKDEDGVLLLEINQVPMEEPADFQYYHFFSVISVNVSEENYVKTLENINELNLETLLGNYGVIESEGMLYHKLVVKVDPNNPDMAVDYLYSILVDLLAIIDSDYEKIISAIIPQ